MKTNEVIDTNVRHLARNQSEGSVLIVTLALVAILMLLIGTTMMSTANKYFTAYQWASWQEALQGAESGADIAMAEMRKDIQASPSATPWVGWNLGNYKTVNGARQKDPTTYKAIDSSGTFADNNGNGNGNQTAFSIAGWENGNYNNNFDFITYSTPLTPHAGEGNQNLRITATIDKPSSLSNSGQQWLRVRATGTTDVSGPSRVSEEKLDNRLRKLGLLWDKVLAATGATSSSHQATRQIELVAKPVNYFAGALTAQVQIKSDKGGIFTNSFNSEDPTNWPIVNGAYDFTKSLDTTTALGKNGDIASNGYPVKKPKSTTLDITSDTIWGDVGNNYSAITGLDPAYYGSNSNPANFGLDNENYGTSNPNTTLIQTSNSGGGDVSGAVNANYYRDLPIINDPTWSSYDNSVKSITKPGNYTVSSDPNHPSLIKVSSISLKGKDVYAFQLPKAGKNQPPVTDGYVQIWSTGEIDLDDGGQLDIQPGVHAIIYADKDIHIGQTKETKTNGGGIFVESDDAKDMLIFGVVDNDNTTKIADQYYDPSGNGEVYTSDKASGNITFAENDFTGAIYAPDHNIVFNNTKDGKGKRKNRPQTGNDVYGSFVGRTINVKAPMNFHYDESLANAGPQVDWGYISWFEDVDVDHR